MLELRVMKSPTRGALVGAAVRQLRRERGWTLEQLSERTDISVSGLSQIETGRVSRVRDENVRRMAEAFNVPPDMLDPRHLAARVEEEAQALTQRQLVDAVLTLPPDLAEDALAILGELAKRKKGKRS